MIRILVTVIAAGLCLAAAQTFEYAALTYEHSLRGRSDNAAAIEGPSGTFTGRYLRELAQKIQPDQVHESEFSIIDLLNVMGAEGWQVIYCDIAGELNTVVFMRTAP